ncbi:MAG: hypothetical protein WC067_01395 [Candidatus Methanomethylophilaceae archaeon]
MSFLDDTKTFGLVATVIGIIMAISGIMGIVDKVYWTGIGEILYALLIILLGVSVSKGETLKSIGSTFSEGVTSKFGILTSYVAVVGLGNIIYGIFTAVEIGVGYGAVGIIIGIIALIFAYLMKDGKATGADKIIWILLAIIFFVYIVLNLLGIVASFGYDGALHIVVGVLMAVSSMLLYLMLFTYLISDEVKGKMGM